MSDEDKFDGKKFGENLRDQIRSEIHGNFGPNRVRPKVSGGIVPGIILVAVGTIFLLDHMGIVRADNIWKFWPLILVAIGLNKLFIETSRLVGIGFILVGGLLQLHELGFTRLSWDTIWPFVLISAGVLMIWSRFQTPRIPGIPGMPGSLASTGRDTVNEFALFGGVERRISTPTFRGGSVTATFGGIELDFRGADIEGEEAVLFVEAVFGGIELSVPERWHLNFEVQSIFAGYSDETKQPLPDPVGATPRKTLTVRGRAVFGGISVKN